MSIPNPTSQNEEARPATESQCPDSEFLQVLPAPLSSSNQGAQLAEPFLGLKGTAGSDAAVFGISPTTALELFCAHIDSLVRLTGDVPPNPLMRVAAYSSGQTDRAREPKETDGVPLKVTELHCAPARDHTAQGTLHETIQQNVLAKRFYSKKAPPISLEDYLLRLQRYCPMSTAVYLATSSYITRMAAVEKIVFVTPRNVHRLVLAGLRVAMKALEDLSYPHSRFARVGGVSERELSRLEISFCFLTDFELRVDARMLMSEARSLRNGATLVEEPNSTTPEPPLLTWKHDESALLAAISPPKEIFAGAPGTT